MKQKTKKSPKLRNFICLYCHKHFQNYLSPADIKLGSGKYCSKECFRRSIIKGFYKKCLKCGKKFWVYPSQLKRSRYDYCSPKCLRKERKLSTDGYWIIHTPNGDMREHRYIMEQYLKRELTKSEIVHHINGNKLDNRIENLKVYSRGGHNSLHFTTGKTITVFCDDCGKKRVVLPCHQKKLAKVYRCKNCRRI